MVTVFMKRNPYLLFSNRFGSGFALKLTAKVKCVQDAGRRARHISFPNRSDKNLEISISWNDGPDSSISLPMPGVKLTKRVRHDIRRYIRSVLDMAMPDTNSCASSLDEDMRDILRDIYG